MKCIYLSHHIAAFSETDAAGVVHFSKMLCWVENAEHACLRELGIEVMGADGGWPRARISVDYRCPLHFSEAVEVRLTLMRCGEKSLTWQFEIHGEQGMAAQGEMVSVRVDAEGRPQAIPAVAADALTRYFKLQNDWM